MSDGNESIPGERPIENSPLRPVVELSSEWSIAVARGFLDVVASEAAQNLHPPIVDECWIANDMAIYLRYRVGADHEIKVATRIPDSNIDPTTAEYALDPREQAFLFLHNIEAPSASQWNDDRGYAWFGITPDVPWSEVIERPRIATVKEFSRAEGDE